MKSTARSIFGLVLFTAPLALAQTNSFPVSIRVDASKPLGELKPIWRFFGADEPNYAYLRDGKKLLGELGNLRRGDIYFRTHNLLCSGNGTPALKWGSTGVYREDANGRSVYDWGIVDRIFDTYLGCGVRPYAQIGFMPKDLSVKPEPYQHRWNPALGYNEIFTGWAYPPKDYDKWRELVFQWVKHCVERYGHAEVETWYWEVWNEANIGYWRGSPLEFRELHDYAVAAVRRALPMARVGGPDTAGHGGQWTRDFLEHCLRGTNFATGKIGTPIDFISFHAKGAPVYTNGHVRMGIANQLRTIDEGFKMVASYPELKSKPIVIGESDPEGCAACQGDQLGYRNGAMYSSYTAASFARKLELAGKYGVNLEGALTWAFTFEDQPLFAGFRQLASGGIDLPVLSVFRMYSQMSGNRLAVESDCVVSLASILKNGVREAPDVSALASLDGHKLCVLAWHYHDDDLPGPDADITLAVTGLPPTETEARVQRYQIDQERSNAFSAWKRMGSPPIPTPEQFTALESAGKLAAVGGGSELETNSGQVVLKSMLPRQAVSLWVVEW